MHPKLLPILFAGLVVAADLSHAEGPAQKLQPEEWETQLKAASELQREAMAVKERIKHLQSEPEADGQAEIDELGRTMQQLFMQTAKQMDKLSGLTEDPRMASLTALRAGQNYMRAEAHDEALAVFGKIIADEAADAESQSQAMYWSAITQERLEKTDEARLLYQGIVAKFPNSKWAKYARGRLTDTKFH